MHEISNPIKQETINDCTSHGKSGTAKHAAFVTNAQQVCS